VYGGERRGRRARVSATPSGWMGLGATIPGVSLRSTPGYCLATLRVGLRIGRAGNPKGCEIVAGGRSQAETSGVHSHKETHPTGVPDKLPTDHEPRPIAPTFRHAGGNAGGGRRVWRRAAAHDITWFCHPFRVDDIIGAVSGGIAAVNPRLLSGNPAGWPVGRRCRANRAVRAIRATRRVARQ